MKESRHYAFLPETTLQADEFKALTTHAKLLLFYMTCRRYGRDEWFTYPYKDIRNDTGYRPETIAKCIRQLSTKGFLEYEHGGLEANSNRYKLNMAWMEI